ncbi:MAG: proline--tRNA ligase [Chloroflexota bacterium]|nr:proline--tRNA ligase [Chloroflexota bacterium]
MRLSKLFGKTTRHVPAGTELEGHSLMLKAGMIHQSVAGAYNYLPLAWRSLRKIENIIREEMDRAGGQEMRLSVLQPRDLWQDSGRDEEYGSGMFRLKDRRGRWLALAPSHEEMLTTIVKTNVQSYKDLPLIIYQIQTKFRDEQRPRGGLLRTREFDMKDAYSFDTDDLSLDNSYSKMVTAYKNIYERIGLPAITVEADSGAIGGKDSQEFVLLSESGEDSIILCDACGYAANSEKAIFDRSQTFTEDQKQIEDVFTPGVKTILELASFLNIPVQKTMKVVLYMADLELIIATLRGDLDVNEIKLANLLGATNIRAANPDEVAGAGLVAGSASPVGITDVKIVADMSIIDGSNFVAGANKMDHHILNVNHGRDFNPQIVGDIGLAQTGHHCNSCKSPLSTRRGIEVGHVFKLGTRYSEVLGAFFPNADGQNSPIIMGCYGIGVGRLLAASIEHHHDDEGMILPQSIAPYHISLIGINLEQKAVQITAEKLYTELTTIGIEVLYDDRDESPGVKFKDADLLGLPIRLVVSPRNLKNNSIELSHRATRQVEVVPLDQAVPTLTNLLSP